MPLSVANFTADIRRGFLPVTVQFTDTSSQYNLTGWNWSFGDGTLNATQNPIHTYTIDGNYTVSLNVTNGRSNITIRQKYINALPPLPIVSFNATPRSGDYPLTVKFTNLSIGCVTAWNWSLGDGTFNKSVNATRTYATWGNYTVSLNVSNRAGYNISSQIGYIVVKPLKPLSNFTVNVTSGMVPLPFRFNDTSTRNATSWNWSFGDGNFSIERNTTYVYLMNGRFNVSLTASNLGGSNVSIRKVNITVIPQPPTASFTSNVTNGKAPLVVQFNDTTTGVLGNWSWNFGDGGTSTSQNPVYQYIQIGTYNVSLTATNTGGSNVRYRESLISRSYQECRLQILPPVLPWDMRLWLLHSMTRRIPVI